MKHIDERIRAALQGLRRTPIPPVPALTGVVRTPPSRRWIAWAGAASALLALALWAIRPPERSAPMPDPIGTRLDAVEKRIPAVGDERLCTLLRREVELLRRELTMARAASSGKNP